MDEKRASPMNMNRRAPIARRFNYDALVFRLYLSAIADPDACPRVTADGVEMALSTEAI